MDLYVESLSNYIQKEWNSALQMSSGTNEARLIIESLDPNSVFSLFHDLGEHMVKNVQAKNIATYFRVATGLWNDWCHTPEEKSRLLAKMVELGAIDHNKKLVWIDEQDRLTWYRNRTNSDEGSDGLVIVLVGLNHATDQGGLEDFHLVDEKRIWQDMGESFIPWLKKICERHAIQADDDGPLEQFDVVLQQLFKIRPLRLRKLATFLENRVIAENNFYKFSDFTQKFFEQLPVWGIPPIISRENENELVGGRGAKAIVAADDFISHKRYKTPAGQKKDWMKIKSVLEEVGFEAPYSTFPGDTFENIEDYSEVLREFIFKADERAKKRLLGVDFLPLLNIFKNKKKTDTKSSKREKIPVFFDMSLQAILQGIWHALIAFEKSNGKSSLSENLLGVHVDLIRFDHDLSDDEEGGHGADELAENLLRGCLGGIDKAIESIDFRLPLDSDQASLPRSFWERSVPLTVGLDFSGSSYKVSRARPSVQFKVRISSSDSTQDSESVFRWHLGPTQPERVRYECSATVSSMWRRRNEAGLLLPAFQMPLVTMTALYFAADENEANRLIAQAMADLKLVNLMDDLDGDLLESTLRNLVSDLITAYRAWLNVAVADGFYTAREEKLSRVIANFDELSGKVLDPTLLGSAALLRRVYKAFLLVDERVDENDSFSSQAREISPMLSVPSPSFSLSKVWTARLLSGFGSDPK